MWANRHVVVGVSGGIDQDLARKSYTVSYVNHGWLFGETTQQTSTHTVGQLTTMAFSNE